MQLIHTRWYYSLLWLLLFLPGAVVMAAEPSIQRFAPKPFGYQMGDVIRHRIVVRTDENFALVREALPRTGALDYWLELQSVSVEESAGGQKYVILLDYQVFYAPLDVRALELPELEIKLASETQTRSLKLPAWEFTISPILETMGARFSESGVYMREDAAPLLRTASSHRQRLFIWLATGLVLAATATGRSIWLRGSRQPFRRALVQLRRLARHGDTDSMYEGVRCVHRAFNEVAGESVFADTLDRLFQKQPGLEGLRQRIENFYQQSRKLFFADPALADNASDRMGFAELKHLCRDCARALK
ncbi:mxaA protein [Methylohalomonas lacus]|uniref:MxaA protein n=1 Tax=Methylohalomonas lacus TaxID=398773 RepID=A0AAE3L0K4_9GAMM|nr:hypothetical protein [Methylohalomonas lacus]MCS3902155.1 mxaA protein [Methylohalomonas lacus]